jgi:hypothetical protein
MTMGRFEARAQTLAEIVTYFQGRAVQGLHCGWEWGGEVWPLARGGEVWGARTELRKGGVTYQSIYVLDHCTGRGHFGRALRRWPQPIVTAPACDLEGYLKAKGVEHVVVEGLTGAKEYRAVAAALDERYAARSGVHYMNHVDEGLAVLVGEGASEEAQRAFCLHPLLQMDEDIRRDGARVRGWSDDPYVVLLAMEYRHIANGYLSGREVERVEEIGLSPLSEVNGMLRADKIQNYKDFLIYHAQTHPRRGALQRYFRQWLERLGVEDEVFARWRASLDVARRARVVAQEEV